MSIRPIHVTVLHGDHVSLIGLTTILATDADMSVRGAGLDNAQILSCDVIVADFDNGMRVLATLNALQMNRSCAKVVIVAKVEREWQILDALKCGASAFLMLGASVEELFAAVRAVGRGECHLSPSIAASLAASLASEPLTERESQVLSLLTNGLCNKHIAVRLEVTVGTVKAHLRSAFDKLGARSRAEAILIAERRGMLRHASDSRIPAVTPQAMIQASGPRALLDRSIALTNVIAEPAALLDA